MTNELINAYHDKMSAQFSELGAKVEVIKAKLAKGAANVRIDLHTQLEDWTKKESSFKKDLEQVKTSTVEGFETVKKNAQTSWDSLSKYFSDTFEKVSDKAAEVKKVI